MKIMIIFKDQPAGKLNNFRCLNKNIMNKVEKFSFNIFFKKATKNKNK